MDSKSIQEMRDQMTQARKLLTSPEWLAWSNFLKRERRKLLQSKVNEAVEMGELNAAQTALALLKDCEFQISLFQQHVKNMEHSINKGVN